MSQPPNAPHAVRVQVGLVCGGDNLALLHDQQRPRGGSQWFKDSAQSSKQASCCMH